MTAITSVPQLVAGNTVTTVPKAVLPPAPSPVATIQVVDSNTPPWEKPGIVFRWRAHHVPTSLKVKDLIERLSPDNGPDGKKITSSGIAECLEGSDGAWLKVSEYWIGEKGKDNVMKRRGEQTIGEIGWNETRGSGKTPPVWISCLVVYD